MTAPAPARPATGARRWVSCADDFALDAAAVEAILHLIELGRVTATSVLVDAPLWAAAAPQLAAAARPAPGATIRADVGLHVNLTQAFAPRTKGIWPLGELVWRCAAGLISQALLRDALARQFDAFEAHLGRAPDYIDGHQHVHQFKGVREALIAEVGRRYPALPPWLRSTRPPPGLHQRKALAIALLGDRALRAQAASAHLAVSTFLVGVYDFRADTPADRAAYREQLARWIQTGPDGSILMCHPATRTVAGDPIALARTMEYTFLAGAEFGALLHDRDIRLVPGSTLYFSGRG